MDLRELRAYVVVAETGGMSAAARQLHTSQSAVSQTVNALERELGVILLRRSSRGVQVTDAGKVMLGEARAVLARHEQAARAMAEFSSVGSGNLRLGIPLELPRDLLAGPMDDLAETCPETRVEVRHLSTAAQLAALRAGELDVGLLRERPPGEEFDSVLVVQENLGVLVGADCAAEVGSPEGIALEALSGLEWIGFPRAESPAWYDELTAILRSHGLEIDTQARTESLTAEVKVAAVGTRRAFTLAPPNWGLTLPGTIAWSPLTGNPITRRTWAVWAAGSRRRDVGRLVTSLDQPTIAEDAGMRADAGGVAHRFPR